MRQKTRLFFSFCISFAFFFLTSAVYVWLLSINIIHLSSIRRPPSLPCFSELVNFTSAGKYFVEFKRKKNCYAPAKVGRYWEKTVHSVFITGTEDLRHTYFEVLCLKEHVFIHWRQWTHLITCGKGKFRWSDYLNLNALEKVVECTISIAVFSATGDAKSTILGWSFTFLTYVPHFFMGIIFKH